MEAKNKPIRVYSIIVSVISVITFIICLAGLISSMIDRQDPLRASWANSESLSSFENFKMEKMKEVSKEQAYIPSDEELKKMYESAKSEVLEQSQHKIKRSITVNSLIIGIALVLFVVHWYLLKANS